MGFRGESVSPAKLLGGPSRGWHAVPARILNVSMAEPEKGILIISLLMAEPGEHKTVHARFAVFR